MKVKPNGFNVYAIFEASLFDENIERYMCVGLVVLAQTLWE